MNKQLTYRPNLETPKDYRTTGWIPSKRQTVTQSSTEEKPLYDVVGETVGQLDYFQMIIPDDLAPLADTIKKAIEFTYVCVDPESIKEENKGAESTELEEKAPQKSKDPLKDAVLSKFQPSVIIKVKEPNIVDQVEYHYNNCLLEIAKYHSGLYKEILANHYVTMSSLLGKVPDVQTDFATKPYRYVPAKFKNNNNRHISDFVIRSQIVRDQNTRLSQKLFNNTETLNLMKACESAKELLKRYLKEEFEPNTDVQSFFKSTSLDDSIALYEQRMEHNLYELYKYLNSSAIALEKSLKMYAKEAQAKAILIQEEEITL